MNIAFQNTEHEQERRVSRDNRRLTEIEAIILCLFLLRIGSNSSIICLAKHFNCAPSTVNAYIDHVLNGVVNDLYDHVVRWPNEQARRDLCLHFANAENETGYYHYL